MIIIIWHYVQMPSALLVLWGDSLGYRGLHLTKAGYDVFIIVRPNKQLIKQCFRCHDAAMTNGHNAFHFHCPANLKGRYKIKKSILSQIIRKYYLRMCCICFVEETHWKPILSTRPTVTTVISLAFDSPLSSVTKIRLLTHSYICTHTHIYI